MVRRWSLATLGFVAGLTSVSCKVNRRSAEVCANHTERSFSSNFARCEPEAKPCTRGTANRYDSSATECLRMSSAKIVAWSNLTIEELAKAVIRVTYRQNGS